VLAAFNYVQEHFDLPNPLKGLKKPPGRPRLWSFTAEEEAALYTAAEPHFRDLLFAAVGRPEMVRKGWIKPGATVIDVGVNRVVGVGGISRVVGDVAFAEVSEVAGALTPVPGGVGPMTIACLLANTVRAACVLAGLPEPNLTTGDRRRTTGDK